MMFKLVLRCLAYLHAQLLKVQDARGNDIVEAEKEIEAQKAKAQAADIERQAAERIANLLKGVVQ